MTEITPTTAAAPNAKPFSNGDYLLWRKTGDQLRKGVPGGRSSRSGNPRFRHPTQAAAEAEAGRLLTLFPESTFIVLHEVARVKLKPVEPKQPIDTDPPHVFEAHARWAREAGQANG
jgi:hypothetical protein